MTKKNAQSRNSKLQKCEPEAQRTSTLPPAGAFRAAITRPNSRSSQAQTALMTRPVTLAAYQCSNLGSRPRKRIMELE